MCCACKIHTLSCLLLLSLRSLPVVGSSLQLGVLPGSGSNAAVSLHQPAGIAVTTPPTPLSLAQSLPSVVPSVLPSLSGPLPSQALSLSMALEPVSARLVTRITSGHFIEMLDLLPDNISLSQRIDEAHASFPAYVLPASSRPRLREVTSLPSWMYCFLTYLSVLTTDPVVRDCLTYARLVIREALRHGDRGWLDYDRLFRQQAALNPATAWNTVHTPLLASTVLGQWPAGVGQCCTVTTVCHGFDHTQAQCALQFVQQPVRQDLTTRPADGRMSQEVCASWNGGQCAFPPSACPRRHVCATCGSVQHRARDCWDTPANSRFKRWPTRQSRPPATTSAPGPSR